MKKVTLTVMAVLFVAAVATSAFAFGWGRGPGYGPCGRGGSEGSAGSYLTPEQTAQFKATREAQWKEMKPLREQMFTKRDEIRKLWLERNPDQEKITAAQTEMRSLRDQMEDKATTFRLDALKNLTSEQRDKIRSSFSEGGFGQRRGMGSGGWGGGAGCFGSGPKGAQQ